MAKLLLIPAQAGYAAAEGTEVLAVQLDGGTSRRRRDVLGASALLDVSWVLSSAEYQYLKAFYRTAVGAGSAPFTIDLILDEPYLVEYTAAFVPGSLRLTGAQGPVRTVVAQLEATPAPVDASYDETIVALFEAPNDAEGIAQLGDLVNIDLPLTNVS